MNKYDVKEISIHLSIIYQWFTRYNDQKSKLRKVVKIMNKEYEYSFKVRDINGFIQYCTYHGYQKKKNIFRHVYYIKMVDQ